MVVYVDELNLQRLPQHGGKCRLGYCQPCTHFSLLQIAALAGLTAALGADVSQYAIPSYTTNSTCPTDNTAGGILGSSIGQLMATANMDASFYSWVGCNCLVGSDDRLYEIDISGNVQQIFIVKTGSVLHVMHQASNTCIDICMVMFSMQQHSMRCQHDHMSM